MKQAVRSAMMVPLLASGAFLASVESATAQSAAHLRVARFWRGNGTTLLEGVVGAPIGAGSTANPLVDLTITDADGKQLHHESWVDTIPPTMLEMARVRGDLEMSSPVRVNVRTGNYTVAVKVQRGDMVDSAGTTVAAFASAPVVSDVIVSSGMRAVRDSDVVSAAESRMGRFAMVRTARPTLQPTEPTLWYYLEAYAPEGTRDGVAQLEFSVARASGGDPLLRTTRTLQLGEHGGADAARLPLQGLPPGEYVLRVKASRGGVTEERTAPFAMAGLEVAPTVAPVAAGGGKEDALYQMYFGPGGKYQGSIDQLIEALSVVSLAEKVPESTMALDAAAKARFLARYFARIPDQVPATPEHELLEEYAKRAQYAAREFSERDTKRSGLRTDRGRIYMKYGAPDIRQLVAVGSASRGAVDVWRYSKQRGLKYAFMDETGFQHFNLLYTTDPAAQSVPDWQTRVGDREVIQMILNF
ncbi:MAG TPA: GWxTD domain-containing protein [Longimicrobiales bacterium]